MCPVAGHAAELAPLTVVQERALKAKDTFRECENCPEMVVVPAGSFTMGAPKSEEFHHPDEDPQHTVTMRRPFAVGKLHVTVDQFAAFVSETGSKSADWRDPHFALGLEQDGSHPVIKVTWNDAKAYVDWLAKKTGKPYRLPSEAEWEYAARGQTRPGNYPRFWFGNDERELCRYGNAATERWCDDGYRYSTSPAGHYEPNAFGLYDMFGNAWQWTADCYHLDYDGAPADGSAWITTCLGSGRVARGGDWASLPGNLRAAARSAVAGTRMSTGFRVARTLTP
jgi:formylglycine-generating enzyme required for sulfatase activity